MEITVFFTKDSEKDELIFPFTSTKLLSSIKYIKQSELFGDLQDMTIMQAFELCENGAWLHENRKKKHSIVSFFYSFVSKTRINEKELGLSKLLTRSAEEVSERLLRPFLNKNPKSVHKTRRKEASPFLGKNKMHFINI